MTLFELIILSIGLAMDASSVAICKGLCMNKLSIKKSVIIGLYFATFQLLMPLIGYYFGNIFSDSIKTYSHLVAFILLVLLGISMLREAFNKKDESLDDDVSFKSMIIPSVATSIDALSVGITFSLLDIKILSSCIIIFIITFILSVLGTLIGTIFGIKYKNKAQILGGIILICMGIKMIL